MKNSISIRSVLRVFQFIFVLTLFNQCNDIDSSNESTSNDEHISDSSTISWTAYNVSGNFNALAGGENMLIAGTLRAANSGTEGKVYVYTADGNNWRIANDGLPNHGITALSVVNNDALLGTVDGALDAGIYASANNGDNWQTANKGLPIHEPDGTSDINGVTCFAVINSEDSVGTLLSVRPQSKIFVGTGVGVFSSADNGISWQAASNGLPIHGISALAVNGKRIFAGVWVSGSSGGVYVSDDLGESWHDANKGLGLSEIYALAVCGNNIFASTASATRFGFDVYVSKDNGNSWQLANDGLPTNPVYSFAVSGSIIYAGAQGGGVYFSNNNGLSWQDANKGLPTKNINALLVFNGNLLAATDVGIFFSPIK